MRSKVADRIRANTPEDTRIFVKLYWDIVVRINQIMEAKGYNQRYLAGKMDKSPSEIHKWLSGEHNFTLKSLAKLEAELGETFLHVYNPINLSEFTASRVYVEQKAETKVIVMYSEKQGASIYPEWKSGKVKFQEVHKSNAA